MPCGLIVSIRMTTCLVIVLGIARYSHAETPLLICCGADEVFIIDPAQPHVKKWSWRAADSPAIPESFRNKFRSTDDCKPYAPNQMLITSSSDGVALIDRRTRKCLFLAQSRNAHSACLLPGNQVVVAASNGGDGVVTLSDGERELQKAFNGDVGRVRLVLVVSPT